MYRLLIVVQDLCVLLKIGRNNLCYSWYLIYLRTVMAKPDTSPEMMFLLLFQYRLLSIEYDHSYFPYHLYHIEAKVELPGAAYLQESIFISCWHVSIHLQGESVEAVCSSVGSSA